MTDDKQIKEAYIYLSRGIDQLRHHYSAAAGKRPAEIPAMEIFELQQVALSIEKNGLVETQKNITDLAPNLSRKINIKIDFNRAIIMPVIEEVFSIAHNVDDLPKDSEEAYFSKEWAILFGSSEERVVQYANEAAQKIFGYSLDEFIGLDSAKLALSEDVEERNRLLIHAQESGQVILEENSIRRVSKGGGLICIKNPQVYTLSDGRQGAFFRVSDALKLKRS